MTTAQRSLRELIKRELYAPDERAVAAAILARALAHATVARASFHSEPAAPRVGALRRGIRARRLRRVRPARLHTGF